MMHQISVCWMFCIAMKIDNETRLGTSFEWEKKKKKELSSFSVIIQSIEDKVMLHFHVWLQDAQEDKENIDSPLVLFCSESLLQREPTCSAARILFELLLQHLKWSFFFTRS